MKAKTSVQNYASGEWRVRKGAEGEFVERWRQFLEWTRASSPGFISARLIRDFGDPRHFVSLAEWESPAALDGWRGNPGFAARFGACRALCDDMSGSNYGLVADVS